MVHPRPHFLPVLYFLMWCIFSSAWFFIYSLYWKHSCKLHLFYCELTQSIKISNIIFFSRKRTSWKTKVLFGGMIGDKKKIIQFHRLCTLANTELWCLMLIVWATLCISTVGIIVLVLFSPPWPLLCVITEAKRRICILSLLLFELRFIDISLTKSKMHPSLV